MNLSRPQKLLVNVGCGNVYHPAWTNLDFSPVSVDVRFCDLRSGLPFADSSVDAVYHSHVLEHLDSEGAHDFLNECARVLRKGGIVRVAVPDLEGMVRRYLVAIESPNKVDEVQHQWLRLELFDQFSRRKSGGATKTFLSELSDHDLKKLDPWLSLDLTARSEVTDRTTATLSTRLRRAGVPRIWRHLRLVGARIAVRILGGKDVTAAFDEGLFRATGEVHRQAYDRIALAAELTSAGFDRPQALSAGESQIPGFREFGLELDGDRVRKPDSLFMEAVRQ